MNDLKVTLEGRTSANGLRERCNPLAQVAPCHSLIHLGEEAFTAVLAHAAYSKLEKFIWLMGRQDQVVRRISEPAPRRQHRRSNEERTVTLLSPEVQAGVIGALNQHAEVLNDRLEQSQAKLRQLTITTGVMLVSMRVYVGYSQSETPYRAARSIKGRLIHAKSE